MSTEIMWQNIKWTHILYSINCYSLLVNACRAFMHITYIDQLHLQPSLINSDLKAFLRGTTVAARNQTHDFLSSAWKPGFLTPTPTTAIFS